MGGWAAASSRRALGSAACDASALGAPDDARAFCARRVVILVTGATLDDGGGRGAVATVFVADASSEAESVTRALRAAGHTVVDVLPGMLVARVAVQHPR